MSKIQKVAVNLPFLMFSEKEVVLMEKKFDFDVRVAQKDTNDEIDKIFFGNFSSLINVSVISLENSGFSSFFYYSYYDYLNIFSKNLKNIRTDKKIICVNDNKNIKYLTNARYIPSLGSKIIFSTEKRIYETFKQIIDNSYCYNNQLFYPGYIFQHLNFKPDAKIFLSSFVVSSIVLDFFKKSDYRGTNKDEYLDILNDTMNFYRENDVKEITDFYCTKERFINVCDTFPFPTSEKYEKLAIRIYDFVLKNHNNFADDYANDFLNKNKIIYKELAEKYKNYEMRL